MLDSNSPPLLLAWRLRTSSQSSGESREPSLCFLILWTFAHTGHHVPLETCLARPPKYVLPCTPIRVSPSRQGRWSIDTHHLGFSRAPSIFRFRCIYGLRTQPTDSRPANRFSCNSTFPVGPERSVTTWTASSERKLMLMDAMSEFDASNRNCRIGKRLEAFH